MVSSTLIKKLVSLKKPSILLTAIKTRFNIRLTKFNKINVALKIIFTEMKLLNLKHFWTNIFSLHQTYKREAWNLLKIQNLFGGDMEDKKKRNMIIASKVTLYTWHTRFDTCLNSSSDGCSRDIFTPAELI